MMPYLARAISHCDKRIQTNKNNSPELPANGAGVLDKGVELSKEKPSLSDVDTLWNQFNSGAISSAVLECGLLGGERILLLRDEMVPVDEEHADLVSYTLQELRTLTGVQPEVLVAVHRIKSRFQDKAIHSIASSP
jgi:hypothetical protein